MSKLTSLTLAAGLAGIMLGGGSALAQQPTFADPEAALEAFRAALFAPADSGRLLELFGEAYQDELIGGDPATVRQTVDAARNAAAEALVLAPGEAPDTYEILLGRAGWPMPIPLAPRRRGLGLRHRGRARGDHRPKDRRE